MNSKRILLVAVATLWLIPTPLSAMNILGVRTTFTNSGLTIPNRGEVPTPLVGPYLGTYLTKNYLIYIGASYDRFEFDYYYGSKITGWLLRPYIGVRHYFSPRNQGEVNPYFAGEIFKSWVKLTQVGTIFYVVPVEYHEALNSPWGFSAAFGTDYNVSIAFSLGIEAGLQWLFNKRQSRDTFMMQGAYSTEFRRLRLYSMLHLDFGW